MFGPQSFFSNCGEVMLTFMLPNTKRWHIDNYFICRTLKTLIRSNGIFFKFHWICFVSKFSINRRKYCGYCHLVVLGRTWSSAENVSCSRARLISILLDKPPMPLYLLIIYTLLSIAINIITNKNVFVS